MKTIGFSHMGAAGQKQRHCDGIQTLQLINGSSIIAGHSSYFVCLVLVRVCVCKCGGREGCLSTCLFEGKAECMCPQSPYLCSLSRMHGNLCQKRMGMTQLRGSCVQASGAVA